MEDEAQPDKPEPEVQKEPLPQIVQQLIEECRMVLPGIQALFGFQLVAIFNQNFDKKLTEADHITHFIAISLIAISIALVMAPAAYHRQAEPETVSKKFVRITSRLLLCSMVPLALGIALDFYLVAKVLLHNEALSLVLAILLLAWFWLLWFGLPHSRFLQKLWGE